MTTALRHSRPTLLHFALLVVAVPGPEGTTRRRVYAFVELHPGLHQRDLARRLGIRPSHAEHHLRALVRGGLLREERRTGHVHYFIKINAPNQDAKSPGAVDARLLVLLRQRRILSIVANLLQEDHLTMSELAARVGISPGTLTYHVAKLDEAGVLTRRQDGPRSHVALSDRSTIIRLLVDYEPPDDLIAGFEDVWEDIGF